VAVFAQVTDDETNAQPGVPDVAALLFEIDDAWRACTTAAMAFNLTLIPSVRASV
jgi:hypothetical protein